MAGAKQQLVLGERMLGYGNPRGPEARAAAESAVVMAAGRKVSIGCAAALLMERPYQGTG